MCNIQKFMIKEYENLLEHIEELEKYIQSVESNEKDMPYSYYRMLKTHYYSMLSYEKFLRFYAIAPTILSRLNIKSWIA